MIFAWSAVLEKGFYAVWGELRPCSGIALLLEFQKL